MHIGLLGYLNDKAKVMVPRQFNERWKAFKTILRADYMDMENSPFGMYKFLEENKWLQFVAKDNTEEKRLKREQRREIAKLKKNPPRLGSKGYRGNEPKWEAVAKSNVNNYPRDRRPSCTTLFIGSHLYEDGSR